MKIKIVTFACAVMLPIITVHADGNANETINLINSQVGTTVFLQSNTLQKPSRRDVAGAVVLDLEQENTVKDTSVELKKE